MANVYTIMKYHVILVLAFHFGIFVALNNFLKSSNCVPQIQPNIQRSMMTKPPMAETDPFEVHFADPENNDLASKLAAIQNKSWGASSADFGGKRQNITSLTSDRAK